MIVEIHKLESCDDFEPLCSLGIGKHTLGRGYALQCPDKRVSRNHAEIDISDTTVTISAKHEVNPCFFRPAESNNISLLKFNCPTELSTGDTFGFFPDQYWYRIKIADESPELANTSVGSDAVVPTAAENHQEMSATVAESSEVNCDIGNNQGNHEEVLPIVAEFGDTLQTELPTVDSSGLNTSCLPTVDSSNSDFPTVEDSRNILDQVLPTIGDSVNAVLPTVVGGSDAGAETIQIKKEVCSDDECQNDILTTVKTEKADSPVTVKQEKKIVRDRCWYADKCFRRNPDHKAEFSHPGDVDYDTDPKDPRPSCSYGDKCYRRNGQHRKDFKHPKGAHAKKIPRRPRQKRKLSNNSNSDDDDAKIDVANITNQKRQRKKLVQQDSPEDDYDYDDPFIDDSEDEYEADSFDSSSDDD